MESTRLESDSSDEERRRADLALVSGALGRDSTATGQLLDRLAPIPQVVRRMNQRLGNTLSRHDVEDVVQAVLTALWAKLSQFDGRRPLEAWCYGFCSIEIARAIERRQRRSRTRIGLATDDLQGEQLADSSVQHIDDRDQVVIALGCLESPAADVLRMKHFSGMRFREIGKALSMPENTAKTVYYRALRKLRHTLEIGDEKTPMVDQGDDHA